MIVINIPLSHTLAKYKNDLTFVKGILNSSIEVHVIDMKMGKY